MNRGYGESESCHSRWSDGGRVIRGETQRVKSLVEMEEPEDGSLSAE